MIAAASASPPTRSSSRRSPPPTARRLAQNGQIDYYVGTYTINDKRKKQVAFAGPYYIAGQGLLVRKDDDDDQRPGDLTGKKVCSATGSTPIQRIEDEYPGASWSPVRHLLAVRRQAADQPGRRRHHRRRRSSRATRPRTPDKLKVVGKPFSEEPYGIGLAKDDNALRVALNDALEAHEDNGDWKKAYDATLGLLRRARRRDRRAIDRTTRRRSTRGGPPRMDILFETATSRSTATASCGPSSSRAAPALLALVLGFLHGRPSGSRRSRSLRVFGTVWVTRAAQHPADPAVLRRRCSACRASGVVLALPRFAVLALGCYTSAFICEVAALRHQHRAARARPRPPAASGMTFGQTLRLVVLPQAFRTVIPPMAPC